MIGLRSMAVRSDFHTSIPLMSTGSLSTPMLTNCQPGVISSMRSVSTAVPSASAADRVGDVVDRQGVIIGAMARIDVVLGDIIREQVDVIVTAANESLLGGGGVDWAVHQAAGPRLAEAGAAIAPCDPGDAKASPAFDLDPPVRHIIHTVGPVWDGGAYGEADILASCYRRCLRVADQLPRAVSPSRQSPPGCMASRPNMQPRLRWPPSARRRPP